MPVISIIVPIYNVEKYLERCLNSILVQTFRDFEVILVDDGSPDGCPAICDKWAAIDKRFRVIHKKNGGLSSARNEGLKAARGDYIGFIDSDDWVAPDMYERLYNLCRTYGADIACGGICYTDTYPPNNKLKNEKISLYTQNEYAELYFKIKANKTVHYAVNKLYNHDVAQYIYYPEGLIDEDVQGFIYALMHANKIVETSYCVYYYWKNESGISYKWFTEKQMDLLTVWQNVSQICEEKKPEWKAYAELNLHRAYFGLLSRLIYNDPKEDGQYEQIKNMLLQKLKMYSGELLKSRIPMTRKMAIIGMCLNYDFMRKVIRMLSK